MQETKEYQYIFIDESNQLDFDTLLPRGFATEGNRVCIGIADETDRLLGTVSYSLIQYDGEGPDPGRRQTVQLR